MQEKLAAIFDMMKEIRLKEFSLHENLWFKMHVLDYASLKEDFAFVWNIPFANPSRIISKGFYPVIKQ